LPGGDAGVTGVRVCVVGGKNSPKESSSGSKILARLSLSPSMNSNPCKETNSSTSWSSFGGAVAVVTVESSFSVENRMASLISGSSELISPLNLSTCSLYGYPTKESKNRRIYCQSVKICVRIRVVGAPDRHSIRTTRRGHHRTRSAWVNTGR